MCPGRKTWSPASAPREADRGLCESRLASAASTSGRYKLLGHKTLAITLPYAHLSPATSSMPLTV